MNPQDLVDNSERASKLLRLMANEKRLMILCNLVGRELSVNEIQEATNLGQSTVSQQLAVLRAEKLVTSRREAQSVFYSLASEDATRLLETLHGIYCSVD
ncbi:MAG TPA: metalloregulator ArsR/SmtB family transcription factor [Paracoccaceae bacterium]|nr:metalloregulator ArsR/SmtB family transcription factor [Paracoccaceae bacterium]